MEPVKMVVSREFPGREVASITPAPYGNRKLTRLVRFVDGDGVVVQYVSSPDDLRTEGAVARMVRNSTPVPVPAVLAVGETDGIGYLVTERASGGHLHEQFVSLPSDERRSVVRAFGRWLAACHGAVQFDGYGDVTLTDGDLGATRVDWREWFSSYAAAGLTALPDALSEFREPVGRALAEASLPERPPARLFPWDLRPGNALYDDGVTAVLDWGEPLSATPALSAAKAEHLICDWYVDDAARERLRAAFRQGYRTERPWPVPSRIDRLVAVVRSAVDAHGTITRPGYPEREGEAAVAFHRARLRELL